MMFEEIKAYNLSLKNPLTLSDKSIQKIADMFGMDLKAAMAFIDEMVDNRNKSF
jgi:hypothetical protein